MFLVGKIMYIFKNLNYVILSTKILSLSTK